MSRPQPNLAGNPFLNTRPVGRLTAILWVAALLLGGANLWVYLRYTSGSIEKQHELERRQAAIGEARERGAALDQELTKLDLVAENDEVAFLNDRIAERTFSWNLLIDRVVEALPDGVRLVSLVPATGDRDWKAGAARKTVAREERRVELRLSGVAEDGDQLLQLVDALFAHPAFEDPNLMRERDTAQGEIEFELRVRYRPDAPEVPRSKATLAAIVGARSGEPAAESAPASAAGAAAPAPPPANASASPAGAPPAPAAAAAPRPATARERLSATIDARQRAADEAAGAEPPPDSEPPAEVRAAPRRSGVGVNPRGFVPAPNPMFVPAPTRGNASGDHR